MPGNVRVLLIGTGSPSVAFLPLYVTWLSGLPEVELRVCLTRTATTWVSREALQVLSGAHVFTGEGKPTLQPEHSILSEWATHIVVLPATFHFCGLIANGLGASTAALTVISSSAEVLMIPSVPTGIAVKPVWQSVLGRLENLGISVSPTREGRSLATGRQEPGATPSPVEVVELLRTFIDIDQESKTKEKK